MVKCGSATFQYLNDFCLKISASLDINVFEILSGIYVLTSQRVGGDPERKFLNKTVFLIAKNHICIAKIHILEINNILYLFYKHHFCD